MHPAKIHYFHREGSLLILIDFKWIKIKPSGFGLFFIFLKDKSFIKKSNSVIMIGFINLVKLFWILMNSRWIFYYY